VTVRRLTNGVPHSCQTVGQPPYLLALTTTRSNNDLTRGRTRGRLSQAAGRSSLPSFEYACHSQSQFRRRHQQDSVKMQAPGAQVMSADVGLDRVNGIVIR
jgi:hypothetical protein